LTERLSASPHLAGETFTAADISVVYALNMGGALGLADDYPAPVADYWARMKIRPGYEAAISK
jgi:glutathione S-transferase